MFDDGRIFPSDRQDESSSVASQPETVLSCHEVESSLLSPWPSPTAAPAKHAALSMASLTHYMVGVARKHFGTSWPLQIAIFNGGAEQQAGRGFDAP